MFGIGGGEMVFIIFIALMLFGSDKIPEVARTLGKAMAQLKNATNDIKSEIQKSAEENGLSADSLTGGITREIENAKGSFRKITEASPISRELEDVSRNFSKLSESNSGNPLDISDITTDINSEINKAKESLEDLSGPIKRQS